MTLGLTELTVLERNDKAFVSPNRFFKYILEFNGITYGTCDFIVVYREEIAKELGKEFYHKLKGTYINILTCDVSLPDIAALEPKIFKSLLEKHSPEQLV